MKVGRWRLGARAMFRAATGPVALSLAGLSIGMGVAQAEWGSLAAAGAFVAAAAYEMTRPTLWRRALQDLRRSAPALPCEGDYPDTVSRELVRRLSAARRERSTMLGRVAGATAKRFAPFLEPVAQLERKAIDALGLHLRGAALLRFCPYPERTTNRPGILPLGLPGIIRSDLGPPPAEPAPAPHDAPSPDPLARDVQRATAAAERHRRALRDVNELCRLLLLRLELIVSTLEAIPALLAQVDITSHEMGSWSADSDLDAALAAIESLASATDEDGAAVVASSGAPQA